MQQQTYTGWRSIPPAPADFAPVFDEVKKTDLYKAARIAQEALQLRAGARALLNQLVGFYGGEPVEGRLLVWPSNEVLCERTGLSERALRYAIRSLVSAGVVTCKDSANGKRYARRSASGQIISAFGFDLSPLILNLDDHTVVLDNQKELKAERLRSFDEVTINRRACLEALSALEEWFPHSPMCDLQSAYDRLLTLTPRRGSKQPVDRILEEWRTLRRKAEERYYSASGGKSCRQKENNNDAPDQSCHKGPETNGGGVHRDPVSLTQLAATCPDAFGYAGAIETEADLIREAGRLRGILGAHRTAWEEACEAIGPLAAGIALFLVLQKYEDSQKAAAPIKNPGGYFRSYIRLLQRGQASLKDDLAALRRKRSH